MKLIKVLMSLFMMISLVFFTSITEAKPHKNGKKHEKTLKKKTTAEKKNKKSSKSAKNESKKSKSHKTAKADGKSKKTVAKNGRTGKQKAAEYLKKSKRGVASDH